MKVMSALLGAAALSALATSTYADGHQGERGRDGEVKVIYWQAPSTMNAYLSGGTKELEAASLVLEPLARYNPEGQLVPWLAEEIPTLENGGVTADQQSITWKIKEGIVWSDGTPLTSEDVKFTWEYCTAPDGGCAQSEQYNDVVDVETPDAQTVIVRFGVAKPFPYGPFVSHQAPILQKAQFADCLGAAAPTCTEQNFNPIGTGPFVVTEFRTNDVIVFEANELYREEGKPAFAKMTLKGGGEAAAAGRAVLETGEFDYAWNMQLSPDVQEAMLASGKGVFASGFGNLVEQIQVNQTNPDPALGEERATAAHPHPFLTDFNVRKALSLAIDRELLVEVGYGSAGRVTCNIINAPAVFQSTANDDCKVQDIDAANALLDEAGWVKGADGIREKDGVRLSVLYQTSTNAVRQDFQTLIKQWWEEIGVETELRNIDASVFFGSDAGSPDTFQKFFADIEMYANTFSGTDPEPYVGNWACDEAPRPETQWQGNNMPRFCSEEYDALIAALAQSQDPAERAEIVKAANDMLMQGYYIIPLVDRGRISAHANSLGGVQLNVWDSEIWNAADWYRVKTN
ncbi:MAG: peptide ABC transporter substrate-binding protein [Pseudomonadota bacterium]